MPQGTPTGYQTYGYGKMKQIDGAVAQTLGGTVDGLGRFLDDFGEVALEVVEGPADVAVVAGMLFLYQSLSRCPSAVYAYYRAGHIAAVSAC